MICALLIVGIAPAAAQSRVPNTTGSIDAAGQQNRDMNQRLQMQQQQQLQQLQRDNQRIGGPPPCPPGSVGC
jgi:hypothetical protein